ncbi:ABC transporter permease [Dactylosporangium sp. CA-233914]|uniref:ABC transporter permease n=1 Tax=Dactylosporangium sp. CA-233914 TaxID=3239934 RepID=UPI003D8CFAA5
MTSSPLDITSVIKKRAVMDPRRSTVTAFALAVVALWVSVPPAAVRTPLIPAVLGATGAIAGVVGFRAGQGRRALLAAGVAIAGGVVGTLMTGVDLNTLEVVFGWPALLASTLVVATPIAFAALGGVVSERAGVMNIGLEGMMLSGAFSAVLGAHYSGSWLVGVLAGVSAGTVLAAFFGLFTVLFGANQVVAGIGANFLAIGLTGYGIAQAFGTGGSPDELDKIPNISLPIASWGSWGRAFADVNLMIVMCLVSAVAIHMFLFRTSGGLRVRAIGEKPSAADTVGVPVIRTRFLAVLVSGGLAALGGAYLSLGFVGGFNENMTNGRGYIALAAMILGAWRPFGALAASLLFGFAQALVLRVPDLTPAASSIFQALPYLVTIVAVAGVVGRVVGPADVGRPYRRGER